MKKKKEKLHAFAHIRNSWTINPRTRVKESKKAYNRKNKHKGGAFNYEKDHLFSLPYRATDYDIREERCDISFLVDPSSSLPSTDRKIRRSGACPTTDLIRVALVRAACHHNV